MTKSEKVASLSAEKSKQPLQKVLTEKEIQEQVQELSSSLLLLSEEGRKTVRVLLRNLSKSAADAETAKSDSTKALTDSAVAMNRAATRLEAVSNRNRKLILFAISMTGFVIGVASLLILLISQPHLLQSLWKVSQAL